MVALATTALVAAAVVREQIPASPALALVLAGLALLAPAVWAIGLTVVCAHLLPLLITPSLGPLSAVDAMMVALLVRAVLARRLVFSGWRRDPAFYGAVLFILAGAAATALSPMGSAGTAFLRVMAYFGTGLVAYVALSDRERRQVLAALVGVALGDGLAALAGVTDTIPTGLPIGRYVGTLGDPGQFGIPVAIALLAVMTAPWLIPDRRIRFAVAATLALALFGSNTRSAWAGALIGTIGVVAMLLARRRVAPWIRFSAGLVLGAVLVLAAAVVTVGAEHVGLQATSTRVRIDSVTAALEFFLDRPLRPTGLGNIPGQFPAYNTWLAMSIALGVPAAVGLAVWVATAISRAMKLGLEWVAAGLAFLTATMTENMVFAGSSLTLSWFVLSGLVLGYARQARSGPARSAP